MSSSETDHPWTREQMATSLANGLSGDERSRFDAHLAACASCAAEYAAMREGEQRLRELFADARPPAGFEDRLIRTLRDTRQPRTWVHPMVRRAAVGVAATLLLGSAGYVVTSASNGGRMPDLLAISNRVKDASNLKQIGLAILQYSNENKRGYFDYDVDTAPSSNAEMDSYGGGFKLNKSIGAEFAVGADVNPGTGKPPSLAFGDGHVSFEKNPFPASGTIDSKRDEKGSDPILSAEHDHRLSLAANEQSKIREEIQISREQESAQRRRTVADLTGNAKRLVEQGRNAEALGVVDQILTIDPKNDFATGVRPLVEDRAVLAEQRRFREGNDKQPGKQFNAGEEKKIPYDDILRYPTNWSDISERRDQNTSGATAAGRRGANSTDNVKGSRDGSDSVVMPTDSFGVNVADGSSNARQNNGQQAQATNAASDAPAPGARWDVDVDVKLGKSVQMLPQVVPFKPTELAAGPSARGAKVEALVEGEKVKEQSGSGPEVSLAQAGQSPAAGVGGVTAAGVTVAAAGETVATTQPAAGRKIIRTANMEFEVDRFDAALAMITKLTQEAGGYIGTTDSEKLPNGKVKGSVTVRVPPDRLDTLVLQLRGIGDLRSQKMDAQDVTKQYHDLEGELRAARAMEERLLEIIKTGKGEIKDLLAAEKELGVWRTKIEKFMGEMKYYDNLVALTTLTITAIERDIRTAAVAKETETVDAGIETDDVETARAAALKAIDEAKGRVIQSDLKRHDAGQFAAQVVAEVPADSAGPLIDRLKQLGKVARFEVQRRQSTPEGTQPAPGVRLQRAETRINLSLYNLANVAPRQTTNLNLAAPDVEAAHKAIVARVEKAGGRVVTSNLSRPGADQVVGAINFEVKRGEAEAVLADVRATGEVMRLTVTENPDTSNVTTAKQGFVVQLASAASVTAREGTTMEIAAPDVPAAYAALREAVGAATSRRVMQSELSEAERANVTALMDFEVSRGDLPAVQDALAKLGDVTGRSVARSSDTENTVDSKVRFTVRLIDADRLPPRETTALAVEVAEPDKELADIQSTALAVGGRVIEANSSQERGGRTIAKLALDVPLAQSVEIVARAKSKGELRVMQSTKDAKVPDGALARARIELTFATAAGIVAPEQGVWASIRRGLATSMTGLMWSLQLIVIGLCFVGPWVLLIVLGWKLLRRRKTTPVPAT